VSSRYLDVARKVISARGRPLTAHEILRDAIRYGLMPKDLAGETMHKTLQARITEDLVTRRGNSEFYRTGPGVYFLRELSDDSTLSANVINEIVSFGRSRPLTRGRVLHYSPICRGNSIDFEDPEHLIDTITRTGKYSYLEHMPPDDIRVGTFSIIRNEDRIFTFTVGKHSSFSELIGKKSVGLRRYIDEFDRDLFSADDFGVDMSAAREVLRNLTARSGHPLRDERDLRTRLRPERCAIDYATGEAWFIMQVDSNHLLPSPIQTLRRLDVTKPCWLLATDPEIGSLERLSIEVISSAV
jgi:hypothetical protein